MIQNEQSLLGCILLENDSLDKIYGYVKPEMFESQFNQDMYRVMLAKHDKGEPIELQGLAQALESIAMTQEQIVNVVTEMVVNTDSSLYIKSYADVLVKDWKSRECKKMFQSIDFSPNTIDDTIADLMTKFELLQENKKTPLKSLKSIVEKCKDNYFRDNKGVGDVKTGIFQLDEKLISLGKKDLTIIAARPAVGKSVFAMQIAKYNAQQGKKVAVFSLEMDDEQLYERLAVSECDINLTRLQRAKSFLQGEKESFNKGNAKLSEYNIDIASGSFTVNDIYALVKHQNYDLIIIDYLQLIEPDKKYRGNRTAEVGEISRGLKKITMRLGIPIIALSQLNRESASKKDKEPDMSELRESGSLEQDASNIIMVWNLNDDDNCIYKGVKIAKCRQGLKGKIGMKFDGDHMTFEPRMEDFWQVQKMAKENTQQKFDEIDGMFD